MCPTAFRTPRCAHTPNRMTQRGESGGLENASQQVWPWPKLVCSQPSIFFVGVEGRAQRIARDVYASAKRRDHGGGEAAPVHSRCAFAVSGVRDLRVEKGGGCEQSILVRAGSTSLLKPVLHVRRNTSISTSISHVWTGTTQAQAQEKISEVLFLVLAHVLASSQFTRGLYLRLC